MANPSNKPYYSSPTHLKKKKKTQTQPSQKPTKPFKNPHTPTNWGVISVKTTLKMSVSFLKKKPNLAKTTQKTSKTLTPQKTLQQFKTKKPHSQKVILVS